MRNIRELSPQNMLSLAQIFALLSPVYFFFIAMTVNGIYFYWEGQLSVLVKSLFFFQIPALVITISLYIAKKSLIVGSWLMLTIGFTIFFLMTVWGAIGMLLGGLKALFFGGTIGYLLAFPFLLPGAIFFIGWYKRMELGKICS